MYKLGKRSKRRLIGVHPILAFAVHEAIKLTKQDFMVFSGVRTKRQQKRLVATGVSKTTNSFHLYGLAVDLVAYVGEPSWKVKYYGEIDKAMKTVIKTHNLPIEWGYDKWGWDMAHWQLTKDPVTGKDMRKTYDVRKFAPKLSIQ